MRPRHKAQGTRHKAQGTRHKAQGTRHKAQGTRHKAQVIMKAEKSVSRGLVKNLGLNCTVLYILNII